VKGRELIGRRIFMAFPIEFNKAQAVAFLEAVESSSPIAVPEGGWNVHNLLTLAGVCHFAVMSHGPIQSWGEYKEAYSKLHPEHREATDETFLDDLTDAILFLSELTRLVQDDDFDQHFEPTVQALVASWRGKHVVEAVKGFRSQAEGDEQ
jgi:hypothetical protein